MAKRRGKGKKRVEPKKRVDLSYKIDRDSAKLVFKLLRLSKKYRAHCEEQRAGTNNDAADGITGAGVRDPISRLYDIFGNVYGITFAEVWKAIEFDAYAAKRWPSVAQKNKAYRDAAVRDAIPEILVNLLALALIHETTSKGKVSPSSFINAMINDYATATAAGARPYLLDESVYLAVGGSNFSKEECRVAINAYITDCPDLAQYRGILDTREVNERLAVFARQNNFRGKKTKVLESPEIAGRWPAAVPCIAKFVANVKEFSEKINVTTDPRQLKELQEKLSKNKKDISRLTSNGTAADQLDAYLAPIHGILSDIEERGIVRLRVP